MSGESSADYPGYDKVIAALAQENFDTQVAKCAAWVGTPQRILDTRFKPSSDQQLLIGGGEIENVAHE